MKTYSTSELANIIGVHPNTIMLYEKWGYIAPVERKKNGYRVYTEAHLEQIHVIRIVLKSEIVKSYMRFQARNIIRQSGKGDFEGALRLSMEYLSVIQQEINNELRSLKEIREVLKSAEIFQNDRPLALKRSEAAELIGVSINVIINWERNGMLEVPRNKRNSYRVYTEMEIELLRIIQILRRENYSTQCICRMIDRLKGMRTLFIEGIMPDNTENPQMQEGKEVLLLSSLAETKRDVMELIDYLRKLINKRSMESQGGDEYV